VLGLPDKFDRYIFCEKEPDKLHALKERIARDYPNATALFTEGDANKQIAEILNKMPTYSKNFRVLALCFVDPCSLNNLHFSTIRELSSRLMDFLILIPSGMDAHRFESIYVKPDNTTIADFLGARTWRVSWQYAQKNRLPFERFIVEEFGKSMEALEHLTPGLEDTKLIRSDEKNLLLYRLVLYSRHKLGKEFWQQAKKYSQPQQEMF
jgi:three-Cys-motif partner protein